MTFPPYSRPARFAVVATDLDGTLLRGDLSVSPRTRTALVRATALGARHLVVTGRPAAGCRSLLEPLGYRGLAVCGQGAQLYDVGADRLLSSATLDRSTVRELVERIAESAGPLELGVVTAGLSGEFLVTPGFGERVRHGWRLVEGHTDLWTRPVEKVLIRSRRLDDDALAALAHRVCAGRIAVTHSGEGMVELLPAGVSKATGLAAAARRLGFSAADTVAFGDMPNDIPMLEWAAHGVAMGNAHAALRRHADEIAPTNEEDGVAVVLERLFPPAHAARPASTHP
ncbi:Cof-type HAD-IIB family hydrolase [Streptomyces sp. MB09-01]|uniref:HAD family hydrolase n=1 Tax=Streptomyces sp. MB09-01 TaxID=3028666 RepID=UPI0029A994FA|nr:Cof-type HAD-IIB family hydrolase [Streptomyces sp. MB09-01]MDX3536033.1 Cof-type HAD-IIB family hydrolase [Streptomyces sp. MB09-01]